MMIFYISRHTFLWFIMNTNGCFSQIVNDVPYSLDVRAKVFERLDETTVWRLFFRFRDTTSSFDASNKRYVITNPPNDFSLLPTDQVQ